MREYMEDDRLLSMLSVDNVNSPERTRIVLSSEIQRVVRDYLELTEKIKVRYKLIDEEIIFMIEMHASKVKPIGYLPK